MRVMRLLVKVKVDMNPEYYYSLNANYKSSDKNLKFSKVWLYENR